MGADITIAVNLDQVYAENPLTELPSLVRIPMHAVNILRHNLASYTVQNADILITPRNKFNIGLIGWNALFDNEKALQIIKEGEEATDKVIPEIEKKIEEYQQQHSLRHRLFKIFRLR
jgi:hypothetical protein